MKRPNALVSVKDMELNGISSVFVVYNDKKIQGIVTIDGCIKATKDKAFLKDILKQDYYTTTKDRFIEDLIDKAVKTKYPIVVVDDDNTLKGIIVRTFILSGLLNG